jgi:carboxynorspermidine decarboxylase
VNPEITFVSDMRYNPCRRYSKLGVPIQALIENQNIEWIKGISGLHFHNNCESVDFCELVETVKLISGCLPRFLDRIDWVNLGGGYLFGSEEDFDEFIEAVFFLREKFGVEVIFEPGKGIIGQAGSIVSTVVDIFINDGHSIAVLDTTTNHMPEVFEYQYKPDVGQESEEGKYSYILAGATCLAGDVFGEYRFDIPLKIGSRIFFENMGAYTQVKANMFNGINLPTIYAYTQDGKLEMKRQFTYDDFLSRCGGR